MPIGFRLMDDHWRQKTLFMIGDYAAGGAVSAATALAVRAAVGPGFDLVLAMPAGMAIGMLVHLAAALFLSPGLGFFHAMVPGSLIGMYGGMLFAMRDSMEQQPSAILSLDGALRSQFLEACIKATTHIPTKTPIIIPESIPRKNKLMILCRFPHISLLNIRLNRLRSWGLSSVPG